ncbi:NADH-quinone oxidoreductase subunit E [Roseovarius sp. LXJ103]|uniref:NADH-quinone oxidoreductase subunit E n=1 Tax=Roseovarius carneus TaxID=2853164 RepID=UPI000D607D21|nr:NADH-quinone oxidoreductase subunit E [Roseovarius carneus]MBZ8119644.1 NADH-quinone oxidoreductase subunit E [Roseovarius carneus]PWE34741.1 fused NADH-quinone oxidoreductase subunit E/endonuclease [Pelagicola sp. LXJ1103]
MLRRLYHEQPETFAFTPANQAWAEGQIAKYPEGRQASAIIPLLWRAQEQEGWLTRPAIEGVSAMLGMAYIRGLEVASFYFMFQLQPVGSIAHIQVCGTTSCMICGAEDLVAVCREKIAPNPHELSADGKFSWEEVECLGACANAPMAQIGKDYYEDLTAARMGEIIDEMAAGKIPAPGPQNGRFAAEPITGLTSLKEFDSGHAKYNASAQAATDLNDTIKRIDGSEVPLLTPWTTHGAMHKPAAPSVKLRATPAAIGTARLSDADAAKGAAAKSKAKPKDVEKAKTPKATKPIAKSEGPGKKPRVMKAPRKGGADDLKMIKGVGPKLEELINSMGFYHFDQISKWSGDEIAWVDQNLEGFKGRVSRDDWVAQADILASGGETEFAKRAKKGGVYE